MTGALKPEPLPGQRYGAAAPACDFAGCTWRACLTGPGGNWCGIHRKPWQRDGEAPEPTLGSKADRDRHIAELAAQFEADDEPGF